MNLFLLSLLGVAQAQVLLSTHGVPSVPVGGKFSVTAVLAGVSCEIDDVWSTLEFDGASASGTCDGNTCEYTLDSATGSDFTVGHADSEQQLIFKVSEAVTSTFSTVSGSATVSTTLFTVYLDFNQEVRAGRTGDITATNSQGEEVALTSLLYDPTRWSMKLKAEDLASVTIDIAAGAAVSMISGEPCSANSYTVVVATSAVDCVLTDWTEWSPCPVTCLSATGSGFDLDGTQDRARGVLREASGDGAPCSGDLFETQQCDGVSRCLVGSLGSKPLSGEFLGMCSGPASGDNKCTASIGGFTERNLCACDNGCVARGDCCQAFFGNNCCPEGDCVDNNSDMVYTGNFPLQCTVDKCFNGSPITNTAPNTHNGAATDSYWCFCDVQCVVDNACCGGDDARAAACSN